MTPPADGQVYLRSYLAPLAELLSRPDVTDLYVNRPGEVWVETVGGAAERHDAPQLAHEVLTRLARQIAAHSHQGINAEHPILSASLPSGERVQIVLPPATRGDVAMAVRKNVSRDLRLSDYVAADAFPSTDEPKGSRSVDAQLRGMADGGRYAELLSLAVTARRNILISGGTSTGKTTFLNALVKEIPASERLIFIEDTPEVSIDHPNALGLLAARSALGESSATAEDLLTASLRLRPDRIILGELRGVEAFTFLRAVNTGHPGSMTTVHADSPQRAIEQIALLVMQGGTRLSRDDVRSYVASTIDVYVQLQRRDGRRVVSEIKLADEMRSIDGAM